MIRSVALALLILAAFGWGLAAGVYKFFPYAEVAALHEIVFQSDSPAQYRDNIAASERGLEMADWDTQAEIVMIGDSITELAPWKDMFPQADILNRGAAGDTVSGVEKRLDAILKAKPVHAFVQIGTNDLNLLNPTDGVLAIYGGVVERLKQAGVEVYLQTIPPCEVSFAHCTEERREAEAALNRGIVDLARRKEVGLIDLAKAFPKGSQYRPDGVHPNVAGYKAWRDVLARAEPEIFEARSEE